MKKIKIRISWELSGILWQKILVIDYEKKFEDIIKEIEAIQGRYGENIKHTKIIIEEI